MSEKREEILPLDVVNMTILTMTQNQQNTCTKTVITNLLGVLSVQPPKLFKNRKFLEALFIAFLKPKLNDQIKSKTLSLFRNGIT